MPIQENLPQIIGLREAEETCSQFVFGPSNLYVDKAYWMVVKGGEYKILPNSGSRQAGDIIFYGRLPGDPSHVAKVSEDGYIDSKFTDDQRVYHHNIWGEPIPCAPEFESCQLFRKKNIISFLDRPTIWNKALSVIKI